MGGEGGCGALRGCMGSEIQIRAWTVRNTQSAGDSSDRRHECVFDVIVVIILTCVKLAVKLAI